MMRYVLALWALPLALFWGWYFLSLNDINFGYVIFSRQVHDFVFRVYGHLLGIDPAAIPGLIMRACAFDTLIIGGIWAFRRRRDIARWWRARREGAVSAAPAADPVLPAE
jgi:hypothetical protein